MRVKIWIVLMLTFIFLVSCTAVSFAAVKYYPNVMISSFDTDIDGYKLTVTLRKDKAEYSPKIIAEGNYNSSKPGQQWYLTGYKLSFNNGKGSLSGGVQRQDTTILEGKTYGTIPGFGWKTVSAFYSLEQLDMVFEVYDRKLGNMTYSVSVPEAVVAEWREVAQYK